MNKVKIFVAALVCLLCTALTADVIPAGATEDNTPKYSIDRLYEIYNEIVADYMSDYTIVPIVMACGVTENGVTVTVRYQYYEEYKKTLEDKYGDAVYVEYTPESKEEAEAQEIVFDDDPNLTGSEDASADETEDSGKSGAGNSAVTQIVVGAVLVVAAAVGVFVYLRKEKN